MKRVSISANQSYDEIISIMKEHLNVFLLDVFMILRYMNEVLTQIGEMIYCILHFFYFFALLVYYFILLCQRFNLFLMNATIIWICASTLIIKLKLDYYYRMNKLK